MAQLDQDAGAKQQDQTDKMASFITILMFSAAAVTVSAVGITFILASVSANSDPNWWTRALTESLNMLLAGLVSFSVLLAAKILYMSHKVREIGNIYLNRILASAWDQEQVARDMVEQAQICDKIKELAFRTKNIDALHGSIEELLKKHDFNGAEAAIQEAKDMGVLGDEAKKFQSNIEKYKQASIEEIIEKQINHVQNLIENRKWSEAESESRILLSSHPDHPQVKSLPDKIKRERSAYKARLLKYYGEAVKVDDIDKS